MQILRAADHRRMPWKNGGGETIEVAVYPAGSGLDAFDWRVSMARVAADGPFSAFPGIDRTLTVLEGEGIRLTIGGMAPVELAPSSTPFSFAADVDADAKLINGPITDLNVMTRRGRLEHHVRPLRPSGAVEQPIEVAAVLLFCHEGRVAVEAEGVVHRLGPMDALLASDVRVAWRIAPEGASHLFLVEINRA